MLTSPSLKHEFRLYGLDTGVTSHDLITYFGTCVKVLGALVHDVPATASVPSSQPTCWAQIWTTSAEEVDKCLTLKPELELKNITMTRAPLPSAGWLTPNSKPMPRPVAPLPSTSPPFDGEHVLFRPETAAAMRVDSRSLARNLYVLGIPINLTQQDFKNLFCPFGVVEHSTLLSQLDSSGRRRGFILMSTHREAVNAISDMNGRVISWISRGRWSSEKTDTSKDPVFFPDSVTIAEVFAHFGPVVKATIIPSEVLTAIITFEHKFSADGVIGSNGLLLGNRPIYTKSLVPSRPLPVSSSRPSSYQPQIIGSPASLPLFQPFDETIEAQDDHLRPARPLPQVPHDPAPRFLKTLFEKVSQFGDPTVPDNVIGAIGDELKNLKLNPNIKLNPESQVFVPGTGDSDGATSQEFNSSSSVGSTGTRAWCQSTSGSH